MRDVTTLRQAQCLAGTRALGRVRPAIFGVENLCCGGVLFLVADEQRPGVPSTGLALVDGVARWARERGTRTAFTFVDHGRAPDGVAESLTWRELDRRLDATAARLARVARPGDRAAILAGSGLDYVVGFLGAIRAGLVAVPLFGPDGRLDRLDSVLADCAPTCALTGPATAPAVREYLDGRMPLVTTADGSGPTEPLPRSRTEVAYLQYTSGSTSDPRGVVITHRNVAANVADLVRAYRLDPARHHPVSWLPLFHDMGLMLGVLVPVLTGMPGTLLDPMAFVQRPARWLRLLGERPGAFAGAPNFAYDLCARRVPDGLRLDGVHVLINGAEPVRPETIARFGAAFAGCGLDPATHRPSYGLAEATVFVSAAERVRTARFDRAELGAGRAVPAADGVELVSVGVAAGQELRIVAADRRCRGEDEVGEIWLRGGNIGAGYWGRADPAFDATLAGTPPGRPAGGWLRTGDLGLLHRGEVYVTGRLKDLVIIDGRNHYPQDIEATVQETHPAVRPGHVVAFAVPGAAGEELVVVAERARRPATEGDPAPGALRRAVAERHGVRLREFVLVAAGAVPMTSSGKLARAACRRRYLAGDFS